MPELNYLQAVRNQYEVLPYPPRDPELEHRRLLTKIGDNLVILNHHCFNASRDFRTGFRALVAGGGTGDSTIYLAEQLRDFDAEVVYLDMSVASMAIARERARIRGLTNIRWITESIMNIPGLDLGRFDYINCTGVLHHLESTEAGLAVLAEVLKDDGVILLMLYGKYGRRSVYDMQELLRTYLPDEASIPEKVRLTRQLLDTLPATNGFVRDLGTWGNEIGVDGFGDAGLYDLLLHSQDRCFDVPEIHGLAESAALELLSFVDRAYAYNPLTVLGPGADKGFVASLDVRHQQAIAELAVSDLAAHEFYLGRPGIHRAATLDDQRNTLVLAGAMHGKHREISEGLLPGRVLTITGRGGEVPVVGTPINRVLFAHMDGVTPLERLYKRVQKAVPDATRAAVVRELRELYERLHPRGYLYLLRQGSYGVKVPDYTRLQAF